MSGLTGGRTSFEQLPHAPSYPKGRRARRRRQKFARSVRHGLIPALLLGTVSFAPVPLKAQVGAATLGASLAIAMNKAQDVVRDATEGGRVVAIEAGIQAENAITQAQVAYESSLNKTVDQLNGSEAKAYRDIETMVQQLTTGTDQSIQAAGEKAQLVANELPLAKGYPQLTAYSPLYATPGVPTYAVAMRGNFPFAFTETTRPVLALNGHEYPAVQYATSSLVFDLPTAEMGPDQGAAILRVPATVTIPYDNGGFWSHVFGRHPIANARYGFQLAKLPTSPGYVVLAIPQTVTHSERDQRVGGDNYFDSATNDIEETRCTTLPAEDQRNGWAIDQTTVGYQVTQQVEGDKDHDWYDKGRQDGNDVTACYRMRTEHHGWGHSGKIHWRIVYQVTRQVPVTTMVESKTPLSWAQSQVFPVPATGWKLTFHRFDGTTHDYVATDLSSDFFTVVASANTITVTTFDPVASH